MSERLREWTPDLLVGLGVLVVGLVEVWSLFLLPGQDRAAYLPVVVGFSIVRPVFFTTKEIWSGSPARCSCCPALR